MRLRIAASSAGPETEAGFLENLMELRTGRSFSKIGRLASTSEGRKDRIDSTWDTVGSCFKAAMRSCSSSREEVATAP